MSLIFHFPLDILGRKFNLYLFIPRLSREDHEGRGGEGSARLWEWNTLRERDEQVGAQFYAVVRSARRVFVRTHFEVVEVVVAARAVALLLRRLLAIGFQVLRWGRGVSAPAPARARHRHRPRLQVWLRTYFVRRREEQARRLPAPPPTKTSSSARRREDCACCLNRASAWVRGFVIAKLTKYVFHAFPVRIAYGGFSSVALFV